MLSAMMLDEVTWQFSVDSDAAGVLHWLVDDVVGYADASALVAAKPTGAASGMSVATIGLNTATVDVTGSAAGNWQLHVGVVDTVGNASNVLSANFTIVSGVSGNLELDGDPLVWSGDQLIFNAA